MPSTFTGLFREDALTGQKHTTMNDKFKCPKQKINRDFIEALYLDYVNNFLTVLMFANYYRLIEDKALKLINLGRKINHLRPTKFNH